MSGLKLMCPICTENFQESDEIYTTSCGHLYHLACMQGWQSRATSCPQCREENPSSHKIFLILNDDPEDSNPTCSIEFVEELQVKLESSLDKIHELEEQLRENEVNFLQMQKQYSAEQELRKRLQKQIDEVVITDEYFLQMHTLYSLSEDRVKTLQEEILRYITENDSKSEQIKQKENDITILKTALSSTDKKIAADDEISKQLQQKILEQENKAKDLHQENARLANTNEYYIKEIALKSKEISVLKEYLGRKDKHLDKAMTDSTIHETYKNDVEKEVNQTTADLKVKHLESHLEKEIECNAKLLMDNKKLQNLIQLMQEEIELRKTEH
ncbi:uncharacterized protein [Musca autumnalis]|uniref:uncharacterized protein n=1 Tax=Musca autumnalis TaxID=221902 RepID=UPI003CF2DE9B